MDSLVQANLHFRKELQWFGSGHRLDMASQGSIRVTKIRFLWNRDSFKLADWLPSKSQTGIWCSGTKKYSQRFEIRHFCLGTFSAFQSSKNDTNPIGEPSVLPFQSEVGGGKRSGAETPTGNPSPAPSASAPHARHDRSMARNLSAARAICGLFSGSPPSSQKSVPSP